MWYHLRPSSVADTEELGRVHYEVWRESCASVLPPEVLLVEGSVERRTEVRREMFKFSSPQHGHFLIEDNQKRAVGFGDCGPAREVKEFAAAEVTTLYMLQEARGSGPGRLLLGTMLDHLAAHHLPSAAFKVLRDNRGGVSFL